MNSIARTPKNQEDGSSTGRRNFLKMLGFASVAGVATAPAVMPAAAAPVGAEMGHANPFGRYDSHADMKRDYDVHMLAHMCMMVELTREWFRVNAVELYQECPEIAGNLHDLTQEAKLSARTLAKSAGIVLDQAYIASQVAKYESLAMGGAA